MTNFTFYTRNEAQMKTYLEYRDRDFEFHSNNTDGLIVMKRNTGLGSATDYPLYIYITILPDGTVKDGGA